MTSGLDKNDSQPEPRILTLAPLSSRPTKSKPAILTLAKILLSESESREAHTALRKFFRDLKYLILRNRDFCLDELNGRWGELISDGTVDDTAPDLYWTLLLRFDDGNWDWDGLRGDVDSQGSSPPLSSFPIWKDK